LKINKNGKKKVWGSVKICNSSEANQKNFLSFLKTSLHKIKELLVTKKKVSVAVKI